MTETVEKRHYTKPALMVLAAFLASAIVGAVCAWYWPQLVEFRRDTVEATQQRLEREAEEYFNQGRTYDPRVGKRLMPEKADRTYRENDRPKAREFYRKAAKLGHTRAMINLAGLLLEVSDPSQTEKEAEEWYREVLKREHETGELAGAAYNGLFSIYVGKDPDQALDYLIRGADLGSAPAQLRAGAILLHQASVIDAEVGDFPYPLDERRGLKYAMMAGENGQADVYEAIALYFLTIDNPGQSAHWARVGAKKGNWNCLYRLTEGYKLKESGKSYLGYVGVYGSNDTLSKCYDKLLEKAVYPTDRTERAEIPIPNLDELCPLDMK